MNKLPLLLLSILILGISACSVDNNDNWTKYEDWRNENNAWLDQQLSKKNADGTDYYTRITASWDNQSYVLIKYLNDTNETKNNLSPLYTSTVDVKYIGRTYDDVAFDSSYLKTSPADSVYRVKLSSVVGGWVIGITKMHVGDSCEIVIPYQSAYSSSGYGTIKPYSNLKFNIRLVGIPGYEVPVAN